MSDSGGSGGCGGAPSDDNKMASAAAMDALNLDDLFLGGGDDDAQGDIMADSLFADMDLDLGDIMDGIIGVDDAGGGGGSISAGSIIMGEEFGGGGGPSPSPSRSPSPGLVGPASAGTGPGPSSSSIMPSTATAGSKGKGKVKVKVKARTARSNPHLAIAQQHRAEQQEHHQSSRSKLRQSSSALANEAKMLQMSSSGGVHPSSQILSPTVKRKRRKTKKIRNEEDDDASDSSPGGTSSILNPAKKSRRSSSGGMGGGRSGRVKTSSSSGANLESGVHPDSQMIASSSIMPQSTVEPESSETQQQQQQEQQQSHPSHVLHPPAPPGAPTPSQQAAIQSKEERQARKLAVREAQESASKFGLGPSRVLFFPYMHLPHEVDVKKRGQKAYPMLERLHMQSTVSGTTLGEETGPSPTPPQPKANANANDGGGTTTTVSASSSIYRLFDEHVGARMDNHGNKHPPSQLQSSLSASIRSAAGYVKSSKKRRATSKHHHQLPTQQNQQQQSQQQHSQLADELSKMYLGCMKQSLFLRQNLWNMEQWSDDHLKKDDADGGAGPVRRRDVEWVLRAMQRHKELEARRLRQEQRERDRERREAEARRLLQQQTPQQASPPKPKRVIDYNRHALPMPLEEVQRGAKYYTHGGPHAAPVVSVKIRVRVAGWRDKSGSRLTARLWCPEGWRAAAKHGVDDWPGPAPLLQKPGGEMATTMATTTEAPKGADQTTAAAAPAAVVATATEIDLSVVDRATMEAVATELFRPDLMPPRKEVATNPAADAGDGTPALTVVVKEEASAAAVATIRSSAPDVAPSAAVVADVAAPDRKKAPRKRKAKEGVGAPLATAAASSLSTDPSSAAAAGRRQVTFIPHIPGYAGPRLPPAALALAAKPAVAERGGDGGDLHDRLEQQSRRLLPFLYEQVLRPSLSPAERRTLLANEIATVVVGLERDRLSSAAPRARLIQGQVERLQSVCEEDKEIVPENCNTIGMWNWMKSSTYFDDLDKVGDVYDGLGVLQAEFNERCLEEEEGCCWGSLSPPVNVVTDAVEKKGGAERGVAVSDSGKKQESSPLFDRLQSLLVEVDGGSDDDGEEEDYNDDLISSLPPFSPEEFIFGPNKDKASPVNASLDDDIDDGTLDVSALTLDQRTYIQLRAVGLADANTTPPHSKPPRLNENNFSSSTSPSFSRPSADNENEPIEAILSRMKSHLSELGVQTNTHVAALQRKALIHVKRTRHPNQQEMNDEAILLKYKQLQKLQREQKEEKQRIIRTSGRVKTGSNKFDDEQWLPW